MFTRVSDAHSGGTCTCRNLQRVSSITGTQPGGRLQAQPPSAHPAAAAAAAARPPLQAASRPNPTLALAQKMRTLGRSLCGQGAVSFRYPATLSPALHSTIRQPATALQRRAPAWGSARWQRSAWGGPLPPHAPPPAGTHIGVPPRRRSPPVKCAVADGADTLAAGDGARGACRGIRASAPH